MAINSNFKTNKVSKRHFLLKISLVLIAGFLIVFGYFVAYPFVRDNYLTKPLDGTVLTPSIDNSKFYSTEAFGGPDSPWGFYHNGIDYVESEDHQPIQAAASGKVVRLEERFNDGSNWQVELSIKHGKYELQYAFEIFSPNKPDIDAQMSDILVKLGQQVKQGQLIGYLHKKQEGAHVHFGILVNERDAICPEPFFTPAAKAATLAMIQKTYPNATLCYPADPTAPRRTPTNNTQTNVLTAP